MSTRLVIQGIIIKIRYRQISNVSENSSFTALFDIAREGGQVSSKPIDTTREDENQINHSEPGITLNMTALGLRRELMDIVSF